ncbi:hypothetical protein BCR32DRAFT_271021 [Anaeromyces robustus]|uniref:Zn(2)-C6 fungal-type domain-containing protein n=1 Tax=Anaeromyces robustus TaxID=1754192 RepID=A0A1Y1WTT6_9FUNG|nr:hypothetical protein BCR32DRAFT_271021 [Anaeromyces robustus]|eukprot:ORX76862.1 hypothetical protein BCR32DRAFT_271021 [Anaeromyces robustus]
MDNPDNSKKKVRRKVTQACENCREKRVKCSGVRPSCQTCLHLNVKCFYKAVTKKRGPRSGYIEEIVSTRVQKEIEKAVNGNLISKENIYKLAKNNVDLFKSSEILKKYLDDSIIKDVKKESSIESTKTENEKKDNDIEEDVKDKINDKLKLIISKIKNNESVIFNTLNEEEKYGKTFIYFNNFILRYTMLRIDYKLIDDYFKYAFLYFPILIKDIILERIKKKAIFPGLLLAIYASTYMFVSKPSMEKSRKYLNLAYNYTISFIDKPNIQVVQALALIGNIEPGTNRSWLLLGTALRMSNLLRLNDEDKSLSKIYNDERKLTFWYILCKDTMIGAITGRSYRYEVYSFINSANTEILYNSLNSNVNFTKLMLHVLLSYIMHKIINYIKKSDSNTEELDSLEEEIDYWFNIFEPVYICPNEYKNEEVGEIIMNLHYNIIFSTLKIVLYRHKPSSVIKNCKKITPLSINFRGLLNNFNINQKNSVLDNSKITEDNNDHDSFLSSTLNILKNKKNKIKNMKKDSSSKAVLNPELTTENKDNISIIFSKSQPYPECFVLNNIIYYKDNINTLLKIDYTTHCRGTLDASNIYLDKTVDQIITNNNLKFKMNHLNDKNNTIFSSIKNEEMRNHKRKRNPNNINSIKSYPNDNKKFKSSDLSNNVNNTIKNYINFDLLSKDDIYLKKVYESLNISSYSSSTQTSTSASPNYIVKPYQSQLQSQSQSQSQSQLQSQQPNHNTECLMEYFNFKNDNGFDLQQENENISSSMEALNKCYDNAVIITEKVKYLEKIIKTNNMKFHYIFIWCFYQTGIIFLIWYVNLGKQEDYEIAKYYEKLLESTLNYYAAVAPYLHKYREMLQEAELSVKTGTRKLVIKDIF